HAYRCLLLETLHHLVKHPFVPVVLEQVARLPGLPRKDLERAGRKTLAAAQLRNSIVPRLPERSTLR
ncbi:hypothetical protein, partial [Paraburkholderia madseniana]|uniref:hypothetical protein n=1 Tax=Paraburkholderia madseniana TaxID=2599607 RepID=UPI001A7EBF22